MDIRTSSALCMVDLFPFIVAGDFRELVEAERLVEHLTDAAPDDKSRAIVLHQLGNDLACIQADRPESDAFLRALKAMARRLERQFTAKSMGFYIVAGSRL